MKKGNVCETSDKEVSQFYSPSWGRRKTWFCGVVYSASSIASQ